MEFVVPFSPSVPCSSSFLQPDEIFSLELEDHEAPQSDFVMFEEKDLGKEDEEMVVDDPVFKKRIPANAPLPLDVQFFNDELPELFLQEEEEEDEDEEDETSSTGTTSSSVIITANPVCELFMFVSHCPQIAWEDVSSADHYQHLCTETNKSLPFVGMLSFPEQLNLLRVALDTNNIVLVHLCWMDWCAKNPNLFLLDINNSNILPKLMRLLGRCMHARTGHETKEVARKILRAMIKTTSALPGRYASFWEDMGMLLDENHGGRCALEMFVREVASNHTDDLKTCMQMLIPGRIQFNHNNRDWQPLFVKAWQRCLAGFAREQNSSICKLICSGSSTFVPTAFYRRQIMQPPQTPRSLSSSTYKTNNVKITCIKVEFWYRDNSNNSHYYSQYFPDAHSILGQMACVLFQFSAGQTTWTESDVHVLFPRYS